MDSFCPNCERHSIRRGVCLICERDFHTGHLVNRSPRRVPSLILPTVREVMPSRLARCFRDPGAKKKIPE